MRRIVITLTVLLAVAFTAGAKPRSVGLGFGSIQNVSMQHMVYGTDNFFQLDLGYHVGVPSTGTMRLTGTYNYMILSPKWTEKGTWNFYAGPGVSLGSGFNIDKAVSLGVTAQVGLEYIFEFPLQLAVDLRPSFGVMLGNDRFRYDLDGLMGFIPTLTARYMF